jgi:YidC/Oxa1 family membrane protein insertase
MDRNSIIGIILILGLFILYGIYNQPSQAERERKRIKDSTEFAQQRLPPEIKNQTNEASNNNQGIDTLIKKQKIEDKGVFSPASIGEDHIITLENDLISLKISTKGGRPYSVELFKYLTYDSRPVTLFDGDSSSFGLVFNSQNRLIETNNLYFQPSTDSTLIKVTDKPRTIAFRLNAGENKDIEYRYTLSPDKYQVDLNVILVDMHDIITTQRVNVLDLNWMLYSPQQEKGRANELQYTNLYYKPFQDKVDYLSMRSKNGVQTEKSDTKVEWIAYKDQFFSSVIMCDLAFTDVSHMEVQNQNDGSKYLKKFESTAGIPLENVQKQTIPLHFLFIPNKFKLLKKEYGDKQMQDLVSVGNNIIKWINQIVIIKMFDFLSRFITNYGIIILIMTIIIKVVLFPLTYKSYLSTAKMKVLKPQIDEINKKIPKEKALERQQATMALYKKVGVSPMGGCLPQLLQLPILFAMFRFFPTSIELRHSGFLWAHDLSTYDSIYEWHTFIPLISTYYGNHISLFTILMTVSTILTIKYSSQNAAQSQQMPGMQTMMYIMPVFLMFFLNKFSAGLTYYYFLANIITFGQNLLFARFVDEEALLSKLESKKGKPVKKSKFQQRLEQMAKQQGYKPAKRK